MKKHDPTYWVFVRHPTHVSFRSDSGYTGSSPNAVITGGGNKAHALARAFGLKRAQYEIIDGDDMPSSRKTNPRPRIGTKKPGRASSATGKPPTKRLRKRRTANTEPGYFPNPNRRTRFDTSQRYAVQARGTDNKWRTIASSFSPDYATMFAKNFAKTSGKVIRVIDTK